MIDREQLRQEMFLKVYCFEKIMRGLNLMLTDKRQRERLRAKIALNKINALAKEGIADYEKQKTAKMDRPRIILP